MKTLAEQPLLLCRVAWMQRYQGLEADAHSNARWVKQHGYGHEAYNFLRSKGKVYGFVQFPASMRIERLGAAQDAESVSPVTVVWTAPREGGGVYVVGWYRDATVFRMMRTEPNDPRRVTPGRSTKPCWWSITAAVSDVHCVAPDDRWFEIPTCLVSQSLINYLDGDTGAERSLRLKLVDLIGGKLDAPRPTPGGAHQRDPELIARVERVAVDMVTKYFVEKGFRVESRERDCCGWDLDATRGRTVLRVEVKGCSGSQAVAELTPNEYAQSRTHRADYRICIVTRALEQPNLHAFQWSEEADGWITETAIRLDVTERIGAVLKLL